jgi:flagellar protein FlgJ
MNFAIAPVASSAADPAATAAAARHRKLTDAAQQFEGMLLQEMLKPMKEHGLSGDGSDDEDGNEAFGGTLNSYGTESVATAIAKGGGLGIAKSVVKQVEHQTAAQSKGTAVGSSIGVAK